MTLWVRRIIVLNIAVFVMTSLVPGLVEWLALLPAAAAVRPWTPITYMFVHAGIAHIFFNMLVLFFFGPKLEVFLGGRRFLSLYFASGLAGAALSFVTPMVPIVGASGAINGVRSEERRVGKECRSRWSRQHQTKKPDEGRPGSAHELRLLRHEQRVAGRVLRQRLLVRRRVGFFFSGRRRHTRWTGDWSSDVCSSDLPRRPAVPLPVLRERARRRGALVRHADGADRRGLGGDQRREIGRASCRERV